MDTTTRTTLVYLWVDTETFDHQGDTYQRIMKAPRIAPHRVITRHTKNGKRISEVSYSNAKEISYGRYSARCKIQVTATAWQIDYHDGDSHTPIGIVFCEQAGRKRQNFVAQVGDDAAAPIIGPFDKYELAHAALLNEWADLNKTTHTSHDTAIIPGE